MAWRLAESIRVLREEVNAMAPRRSKVSDGTIGDAAHASRNSDHNPYIKDARGIGVVRAIDITHDPGKGCHAGVLADHVRNLGRRGDPRVRYVIWNRQIASAKDDWAWRTYSGSNPHDKHVHISVVEGRAYDSTQPWGLAPTNPEEDDMPLSDDDVQRIAVAVAGAVDKVLQDDLVLRDRVQSDQVSTLKAVLDRIAKKIGA